MHAYKSLIPLPTKCQLVDVKPISKYAPSPERAPLSFSGQPVGDPAWENEVPRSLCNKEQRKRVLSGWVGLCIGDLTHLCLDQAAQWVFTPAGLYTHCDFLTQWALFSHHHPIIELHAATHIVTVVPQQLVYPEPSANETRRTDPTFKIRNHDGQDVCSPGDYHLVRGSR
jgi:hypothetical protein